MRRLALTLLVILLSIATPASSQSRNLREEVRQKGYAKHGRWLDLPLHEPHTLAQLIKGSTLIVRGEVVNETTRLSTDESEVMTDFTVSIAEVLKDPQHLVKVGDKVVISKYGGNMLLEGKPVVYETTDFPPIPWHKLCVFFVVRSPVPNDFWEYIFRLDGFGVWRFALGKMECETRRKKETEYTGSFCGKPEDEVVSELKAKIAAEDGREADPLR
ncbi:MAG TPA: hypothetical protein VN577_22060 [Terriglobales bacterium]|nr:hypothetical protein [Terriglobales bacterium]